MDLALDNVKELISHEFSKDIGLIPRDQHPTEGEICDRLLKIVLLNKEGTRTSCYRQRIISSLNGPGMIMPGIIGKTDLKVLLDGIILERVSHIRPEFTEI